MAFFCMVVAPPRSSSPVDHHDDSAPVGSDRSTTPTLLK